MPAHVLRPGKKPGTALDTCCEDQQLRHVALLLLMGRAKQDRPHDMSGVLSSAIHRPSNLICTAEHVVTLDWSTTSLELGDYLVGDAAHGIHHDFARDR